MAGGGFVQAAGRQRGGRADACPARRARRRPGCGPRPGPRREPGARPDQAAQPRPAGGLPARQRASRRRPDEITAVLHHPDGLVWRTAPDDDSELWHPIAALLRPRPAPGQPERPDAGRGRRVDGPATRRRARQRASGTTGLPGQLDARRPAAPPAPARWCASATPAVRSSSTCVREALRGARPARWPVRSGPWRCRPRRPRSTSRARSQSRQRRAVLVGALEAAVRRRRTRPCRRPRRSRRRRRPGRSSGGSRLPSVPATQCARPGVHVVRGARRSGRRGRCGGRGWPRRGGSRRGACADQVGDGGGDVGAARHREAAALAEVVLHIDDDQVRGAWCVSFGWSRGWARTVVLTGAATGRDFGSGAEPAMRRAGRGVGGRRPALPAQRPSDVLRRQDRLPAGELRRRQRQPGARPRCAGRAPRPAARGPRPRRP